MTRSPCFCIVFTNAGSSVVTLAGSMWPPPPVIVGSTPPWRNSRRCMGPRSLFQRKGDDRCIRAGAGLRRDVETGIAAARDRDDELLAVRALIGERRHQRIVGQRRAPELLAALRVEGAEAEVGRRADEDEPAGRGNRPAVVDCGPGVEDALLRQLGILAERRAPDDVTRLA